MSTTDHNDKKIQELLEQGQEFPSDIEASHGEAYKTLFDALGEKPSNGLPYMFSNSVIGEIQSREAQKVQFRNELLVPVFIIIGLVFSYFALSSVNSKYGNELLQYLVIYKWFFVFGFIIYLIVEFLDFTLVKKDLR